TMLDDPQIKVGLSIVSQMPVEALDIISEINVKDPQKIIIYTTDQIEVRIGDSTDFKNKFIIMNRILEQLSLNSKKDSVQYVDISLPDKPVIFY
ncbi:MAG: cell division protein FtsQ/DivIB, partial [Clostridiales bacterium]